MNTLGSIALMVAFVVTIYSAFAGFIGGRRNIPELVNSARNGVMLYAVLTTIAFVAVIYAFASRDFSLALVANHSSRDLPPLLTLTAVWSGQAGSLLFWTWVLSLYSAIAIWWNWTSNHTAPPTTQKTIPFVSAVLMALQIFFAFMLNFVASPFKMMDTIPPDGVGLNPLLTHPLMSVHPPLL